MDAERRQLSGTGTPSGRDFLFQVLQFLEEERLTAVARKCVAERSCLMEQPNDGASPVRTQLHRVAVQV